MNISYKSKTILLYSIGLYFKSLIDYLVGANIILDELNSNIYLNSTLA